MSFEGEAEENVSRRETARKQNAGFPVEGVHQAQSEGHATLAGSYALKNRQSHLFFTHYLPGHPPIEHDEA